jgi:hypothetical protein
MLFYKKFRKDLESIGFEFNKYDPCVANRVKYGNQHTVRFHVDDVMSSHLIRRVNDEFLRWLNRTYGKHGEVKSTRGKVHDFLGMTFDFREKGKLKVKMLDYVDSMIKESPFRMSKCDVDKTPAAQNLFEEGNGPKIDAKRKEAFHTLVAKGLFLSKRARPDIQPVIAVLSTRVRNPNEDDWQKLKRFMRYMNGSKERFATYKIDNIGVVKWFIDASFAVHPDFRSHTGAVMTMGQGGMIVMSKKQKLNTKSSTESELVGVDDASVYVIWTKLFIEAQGYAVRKNIIYQDNKSAILLEVNGRRSAG